MAGLLAWPSNPWVLPIILSLAFILALGYLLHIFRRRRRRNFFARAVSLFVGKQLSSALGDIPIADVPPSLSLDSVHFSITAPLTIVPDSTFELTFWAHLEEQREEVLTRAKRIAADYEPLFRSEGPFELQRGSRLSIRVSLPAFKIEPAHKPLLWVGEIATTAFLVSVPPDARHGTHAGRVSIRLNGLQIAKMSFLLAVGSVGHQTTFAPSDTTFHKTAFASYASEDRDEVLARIQGMEAAAKHLKVFVDIANLRSGQLWEQELWTVIPRSDVFYLFWCRHARDSPWVEKEWRYALSKRGLDFIDPVPLEPPELAPPPKELAAKHFNDPLLAFLSTPHRE